MPTAYGTLQRKKRFLDAFRRVGVVVHAAKAAGVDRSVVYDWKRDDPEFLIAFVHAEQESTEVLEAEAVRRATRTRLPSDTLLIFLLKARRPEVYRDRVHVQAEVDARVTERAAADAGGEHLTDADVDRIARTVLGG